MADLLVTVGADTRQYNAAMQQVGQTAQATGQSVSRSLGDAAMQTDRLGGSALSASQRMMQMRSGISAARDGVLAFTVGGQAAERSLLAMGHHINSLVNETGSFKGAMSALASSLWGPGGIILGLSVAVELFLKYRDSQKEAAETKSEFQKATETANRSAGEEISKLTVLYDATQNVNLSHQQRLDAVRQLQKEYPSYFANMSQEAILAGQAAGAYDRLTNSIVNKAAIEAASEPLKGLFKELTDLQALQKQMAGTGSTTIGKNKVAIPTFGLYDQSTDANGQPKNELRDIASEIDNVKKKILDARLTLQSMVESFGTESIIDPKEISRAEALRAEIKRLQEDILANPANKSADLLKIADLKKQLDELTPSTKKAKDGFAALNETISNLEKQLQDSVIAGKINANDTDSPLVRKLNAAKAALQSYKDTFDQVQKGLPQAVRTNSTGDAVASSIGTGLDAAGLGGKKFGQPDDIKNMQETVKAFSQLNDLRASGARGQAEYNAGLKDEQKTLQGITSVIGGGLTNAFASALSGGQSFFSAMGQFLVQLIERLIAAAAAAAILAALLSVTSFGSSAAAGAASFGGLFGQLSGLKGLIPGHADGGITSRAHLAMVGEGREKEAILPLSKLNQFVQTNGGGMSDGKIVGILRGPDLLLQYQRATKSQSRTS